MIHIEYINSLIVKLHALDFTIRRIPTAIAQATSGQCSLSILPEIMRKPPVF